MLLLLTAFGSPLTAADAEHIDRCIAEMSRGDTGALAKVYERTHAALYGFSLFLLKNPQDAEDAVQETFVKAYQSAAQYRSQGKPMAWLMTIARNEALQLLRERRAHALPAHLRAYLVEILFDAFGHITRLLSARGRRLSCRRATPPPFRTDACGRRPSGGNTAGGGPRRTPHPAR